MSFSKFSLQTPSSHIRTYCGACRVSVGGETKFVCVDGPEFDAHQVDFDEMMLRLNSYKPSEAEAYESYLNNHPK